jgi:uncharacterized protein
MLWFEPHWDFGLLAYVLSLPISLASLGMPRLEHIEQNVALACTATPMSSRQRRMLSESIASERKVAMVRFFETHQDA